MTQNRVMFVRAKDRMVIEPNDVVFDIESGGIAVLGSQIAAGMKMLFDRETEDAKLPGPEERPTLFRDHQLLTEAMAIEPESWKSERDLESRVLTGLHQTRLTLPIPQMLDDLKRGGMIAGFDVHSDGTGLMYYRLHKQPSTEPVDVTALYSEDAQRICAVLDQVKVWTNEEDPVADIAEATGLWSDRVCCYLDAMAKVPGSRLSCNPHGYWEWSRPGHRSLYINDPRKPV